MDRIREMAWAAYRTGDGALQKLMSAQLTAYDVILGALALTFAAVLVHGWVKAVPLAVTEYEDGTVVEWTLRGKKVRK